MSPMRSTTFLILHLIMEDTLQIGSGRVCLFSTLASSHLLHLNDVFYVSSHTKILLSLSRLLLDNDLVIRFSSSCCFVKDCHTKQSHNGLHTFKLPASTTTSVLKHILVNVSPLIFGVLTLGMLLSPPLYIFQKSKVFIFLLIKYLFVILEAWQMAFKPKLSSIEQISFIIFIIII